MLGKKNIVGWSWGGTKPLRFIPDSPLEASPTRLLSKSRQAAGELGVWPLLQENFHGLRSLVGYSPWCRKESDMTERLYFTHPLKIPKWNFMFPHHIIASLVVQWQRILLPMQEMWVQSLAREDPLEEEEMINRSSIPAWEVLWTEEPGGLQSMGSQSQAGLSTSHHSNKDSLTVLTLMQGDWWWPQGAPCELSEPPQAAPPATPLLIQILTSHLQPEENRKPGFASIVACAPWPFWLHSAPQIGSFCDSRDGSPKMPSGCLSHWVVKTHQDQLLFGRLGTSEAGCSCGNPGVTSDYEMEILKNV